MAEVNGRMIAVEGIHHVSLTVTDLGRARRFYVDVLGFTETPRPDFDFSGAWFQLGSQQLHLILNPTSGTLRGKTDIDSREGHVALRVGSYRDTLSHLQALGIPCDERPKNKTPWPQIFLTDPDGNVIELSADRFD